MTAHRFDRWSTTDRRPRQTHFAALVNRLLTLVQHVLCGLGGHEMVRHFEPGRLSLRCLSCGAQTSGWSLDGAAASVTDTRARPPTGAQTVRVAVQRSRRLHGLRRLPRAA